METLRKKTNKMADGQECCREKDEKILLFLSNDEIFVWDKESVMILRRKYRIVGSLVGSLPSKPRQNLVFSLPLVLLPEEARLLLDKNIARAVQSNTTSPTHETILKFQKEREANIQEQIERLEKMKQQKLVEFAEIIEEGREKVNRKRKILSHDCSGKVPRIAGDKSCVWSCLEKDGADNCPEKQLEVCAQQLPASICMGSKEIGFNQDAQQEITTSSENVTNYLQDSTLVCINTKSRTLETENANLKFPETEIEQARCKIFSDLWEKGYFITNGSKFGGDYLVYPGDPLRFHSHFIVKVLPWKEKLTGLDLVAVGRLGSTVKKTSVLASVNSSGNVVYSSIQWSGFV